MDSRTDIYSLALTLYEGFVRRDPSDGKRLRELLLDASRPDIAPLSTVRPDLPQELSDTLRKAMARDRYSRPDAATFGRMLAQAAKLLPEGKRVARSGQGARRASRLRGRSALPPRSGSAARGPRRRGAAWPTWGSTLSRRPSLSAALSYVLPRVPFYPTAAIIPLIAVSAFIALLWPFGGGVLTPGSYGAACLCLRAGLGCGLRGAWLR